jgi:hypothetical protein
MLKQIYYLEDSINNTKITTHTRFDKVMSSVPFNDLPPFAIQLHHALGQTVPPVDDNEIGTPSDIDLMSSALH